MLGFRKSRPSNGIPGDRGICLANVSGDTLYCPGKVVAIVAFDQSVWTKQASDLVAVIDQDIRQRQLGTSIALRIAGTATALTREGLRERGWNIVEHISP